MSLELDWCSYSTAKYAVANWHYSKQMPAGKNVYIGVLEDGLFIGCVMFGLGSGNSTNGTQYGLQRSHEMAELTRIALRNHRTPVSRIISVAIQMLRRQSPKLRLLISLADIKQYHVGTIYQAANWIYTGTTKPDVMYFRRGKWMHHRSAGDYGTLCGLRSIKQPAKHRYLMPLDFDMRKRIQSLAKPYPKRAGSDTLDTLANHARKGGSLPTSALPFLNGK